MAAMGRVRVLIVPALLALFGGELAVFFVSVAMRAPGAPAIELFRRPMKSPPSRATDRKPAPLNGAAPISANTAASIAVNPVALVFDRQDAYTSNTARTIHVVNLGPRRLVISHVTLAGPNARDFRLRTSCLGRAIDVDQGCTIDTRFSPATAGARTAAVVIDDSADTRPYIIPLAGRA